MDKGKQAVKIYIRPFHMLYDIFCNVLSWCLKHLVVHQKVNTKILTV